jgi:hypothetical protein
MVAFAVTGDDTNFIVGNVFIAALFLSAKEGW